MCTTISYFEGRIFRNPFRVVKKHRVFLHRWLDPAIYDVRSPQKVPRWEKVEPIFGGVMVKRCLLAFVNLWLFNIADIAMGNASFMDDLPIVSGYFP